MSLSSILSGQHISILPQASKTLILSERWLFAWHLEKVGHNLAHDLEHGLEHGLRYDSADVDKLTVAKYEVIQRLSLRVNRLNIYIGSSARACSVESASLA